MKVVEFSGNKKDLVKVADELMQIIYSQDPPLTLIEIFGLLEVIKFEIIEDL